MEDIRIFLLLMFFLVIVCRKSENFVEDFDNLINMEGQGISDETVSNKTDDPTADVVSGPTADVVADPTVEKDRLQVVRVGKSIMGWEDAQIYSAPNAPNFGSIIGIKDVKATNKKWAMKGNGNGNSRQITRAVDSQMPSVAPSAIVQHKLNDTGGDNPVEVHMVYAEWCGHSKNAKPPFEELVNRKDITTESGRPVSFVMTEEKSDNFKDFKVQGFPTYMVKDGGRITPINVGDRSVASIIDAAKKLP